MGAIFSVLVSEPPAARLDFQAMSVTKERQKWVQQRIKIESVSKYFGSKFRNLVGCMQLLKRLVPSQGKVLPDQHKVELCHPASPFTNLNFTILEPQN